VPLRRALPPKVIVGYATSCDDKVETAVRQGVNVVIWAFLYLKPLDHQVVVDVESSSSSSSLDVSCIQSMIERLDGLGFKDTVHLVSMGGWNGPHLNPAFPTATSWWEAWMTLGYGTVFHGIDIDFEGNTNLASPTNYFSVELLDQTGQILQLASDHGYITSIVPAQSYLDVQSSKFSLYVNMTDSERHDWHSDFSYFGQNVYAYLLAKYGDAIDLVLLQFYESYSRASLEIHHHHVTPEAYLSQYMQDLSNRQQVYEVDFAMEPAVGLPKQGVSLPISKLVWGFSSACAATATVDEKCLYILPECIQAAYQESWDWMVEPRGFMFWFIGYEGTNGLHYAKELNDILHIRSSQESDDTDGAINVEIL
jgi:Glycosyl hydrolases family 18